MGGATTYRARTNGVEKGLLVVHGVLTVAAAVAFGLAPGWVAGVSAAVLASQVAFWWSMRPGWVTVADDGLHVKGADGARLRPRRVPWSQIRGMRRPRWTQVVVLELEGGGEQPLPELSTEDRGAVVTQVTARTGAQLVEGSDAGVLRPR